MPLRKHIHPRDLGNWPPTLGTSWPLPDTRPEPPEPTELELILEDLYARAATWEKLARILARQVPVNARALDVAAKSLTSIALLHDISPRYRSWMDARVTADLLGLRRPRSFRPNAPEPSRKPPLRRLTLR